MKGVHSYNNQVIHASGIYEERNSGGGMKLDNYRTMLLE